MMDTFQKLRNAQITRTGQGLRPLLTKAIGAVLLFLGTLASLPAAAQFQVNKKLYPVAANPAEDIAAAEAAARREHKRILLDFGGNWCGDCQVLDYYYHQQPNAGLLAKYFLVVHIDIGHMDHNVDIAHRYGVPIAHGVPALAVIDAHGKVLYAEHEKEFEHTSPEAITAFLNHWKG